MMGNNDHLFDFSQRNLKRFSKNSPEASLLNPFDLIMISGWTEFWRVKDSTAWRVSNGNSFQTIVADLNHAYSNLITRLI